MEKVRIDTEALRQKLQEQNKRAEEREAQKNDPSKSTFVKTLEAGKQKFRAVPYIHNDDPSVQPYVIRAYHFQIPGSRGGFYCPQENAGQTCHVCDFVWAQMKRYKGNKEVVKSWAQKLPKFYLFLPGILRDREDEGVKLLRVGTRKNEKGKRHQKIDDWFMEEDTFHWMDPDKGIDVVLEFEELDEERSKRFGGAKFALKEINLDRKDSSFGKKLTYEKALEQVPNIDEVYEVRTTEDSLDVLSEWQKKLGVNVEPDVDSGEFVSEDGDEEESMTKASELKSKLDKLLK